MECGLYFVLAMWAVVKASVQLLVVLIALVVIR